MDDAKAVAKRRERAETLGPEAAEGEEVDREESAATAEIAEDTAAAVVRPSIH